MAGKTKIRDDFFLSHVHPTLYTSRSHPARVGLPAGGRLRTGWYKSDYVDMTKIAALVLLSHPIEKCTEHARPQGKSQLVSSKEAVGSRSMREESQEHNIWQVSSICEIKFSSMTKEKKGNGAQRSMSIK